MSAPPASITAPIRIHKYGNRRLYRTDQSRYVTLSEIAQLVRDDQDFVVSDAKSGNDLTGMVLAQVILDEEKRGVGGKLPLVLLKQIISLRDERLADFVESHLPRLTAHYLASSAQLEATLQEAISPSGKGTPEVRAELIELVGRMERLLKSLR